MCCSPADGGEISYGKERRGAGFEDGSPGEGGQAAGERGALMILIMEIMVMLAMKLVILRMLVHLEREGRQPEREVLNITILTETWILQDCDADVDVDQYHGDRRGREHSWREGF